MRRKRLNFKKEGDLRRIQWILGIPYSARTYQGQQAEKAVLDALKYFQRKKTEFSGGRTIKKVSPTTHFSDEDLRGVDIEVKFDGGEDVPIQVKSWWIPGKKKKIYRERAICLITVPLKLKDRTSKSIKKETRHRVYHALAGHLSGHLSRD